MFDTCFRESANCCASNRFIACLQMFKPNLLKVTSIRSFDNKTAFWDRYCWFEWMKPLTYSSAGWALNSRAKTSNIFSPTHRPLVKVVKRAVTVYLEVVKAEAGVFDNDNHRPIGSLSQNGQRFSHRRPTRTLGQGAQAHTTDRPDQTPTRHAGRTERPDSYPNRPTL